MTIKFTVRQLADLPPDRQDKYADIVVAYKKLRPDEALFIEAGSTDGRTVGAMMSAVKKACKRNGIESIEVRSDPSGGGVWLWPKLTSPPKSAEANGAASL
jgi:hypothetical protein